MSFNENDSNSIIVNYYQSEKFSMKTNVILELLMVRTTLYSSLPHKFPIFSLNADVHRRTPI